MTIDYECDPHTLLLTVRMPVADFETLLRDESLRVAELARLEQMQRERCEAAIALLESWRDCSEEEAQEQRETWEFLKKALDEDRLSYRKLFPKEGDDG